MNKASIPDYFLALGACLITIAMVLYPDVAFQSALYGLKTWFEIVFPALLPFFIGSQLLMGLGVVHFMGVLLEPFMRPLFNVPGAGSFVMAMGLASGYPIGSILTAELRRQGMCNKAEAERLMSFTNTADPLFMSGAVAVGMLQRPEAAPIIMSAHYISSLILGLIMRFHAPLAPTSSPADDLAPRKNPFTKALHTMRNARQQDGRPLGKLMGDAVARSIDTILLIGGFIILFSVIIKVLNHTGVIYLVNSALSAMLKALGVNPNLTPAIISGLFEITIGTQAASQAPAPLSAQLIIINAIIAWSGLSVHAQVAAVTQGTDISVVPYFVARIIHALLAALVTVFLLPWLPLATALFPVQTLSQAKPYAATWLTRLNFYTGEFVIVLGILLVFSLIISRVKRFKFFGFWHHSQRR